MDIGRCMRDCLHVRCRRQQPELKARIDGSTWAVLLYGAVSVLLIVVALWSNSMVVVGGVLALLLGVILVVTKGLRALSLVLALASYFFSPMIAVRLAEALTFGDVFLVAAVGVALLAAKDTMRLPGSGKGILAVMLLMVAGGSFATIAISQDPTTSASQMLQYAIAIGLSVALVRLLKPSKNTLIGLGLAFGLGSSVSCAVAIADKVNPRPAGLALHSNHLAISSALAVGIWIALLLASRSRLLGLLSLAGIVTCVWGTVIGGSRAGVVALVVVVAATVLGIGASKLTGFLVVAAGGSVVAILMGYIDISGSNNAIGRLLGGGTAEQADQGRSVKYEGVWDRIEGSAWFGTGFADARDGHSLYLQMWDSAGVLGIVAAIVLVLSAALGWMRARQGKARISVALWSGYLGYLAAAILSNQMWDRYIWLALALAVMSEHLEPPKSAPPAPRPADALGSDRLQGALVKRQYADLASRARTSS